MGIRYESVRIYLKRVFSKFEVHTQSQLVSSVLGGGSPAVQPGRPRAGSGQEPPDGNATR